MLQLGFGARLNSAVSVSRITAREAADAGLRQAVYAMNQAFKSNGSIPASFDYPALNNSEAGYSYTITPDPNSPIQGSYYNHYLVKSTGTSKGESKRVCAITGLRNIFDYGLIVSEGIVLKSGTVIDGYLSNINGVKYDYGSTLPDGSVNSGMDVRIGTNSAEPKKIILAPGSIVNGDILAGIGGEIEGSNSVIYEGGGAGNPPIYDNKYNLFEPFEFEQITPPTSYDGPTPDLIGDDKRIDAPIGYTYENPYTLLAPSMNIGQGGRLTVVGHVELYITGNMTLKQDSELYIGDPLILPTDPNYKPSSLIIYLDGDLVGNQAGGINNLSEIPAYFMLLGTGGPYQDWQIHNSRSFYGVYYGPNAEIYINNDADIYGSVAGYSYEMKNSGILHYDVALSDLVKFDTGFGIDRWWEEVVP
jgi:hypothetical protein